MQIWYAGQFTLYKGMLCFVNKIVKILYLISLFNIVVFCVSTTVGVNKASCVMNNGDF